LSFAEISSVVKAPENTVKSRMRYALEFLRKALAEFADNAL
jgi:DNA-directed RNA polymerase specialized sigma24 family protein